MSNRDRVERDTDDEIRAHLEHRVEALMRRGMSRPTAESEALRLFGPLDVSRAELVTAARHRERVLTMFDRLDALRHDLGYALRQIRRAPGLAITVVLTFALGVGGNATMFGVVDRLLLRPPAHVTAPEEIVRVQTERLFGTEWYTSTGFSYPMYAAVRDQARSFRSVAMQTFPNPLSLGLGPDARRVQHMLVSGNWFQTLRAPMHLGRPLLPEDDVLPDGSPVVVIGHGLWQRVYGSDPDILGKRITLPSGQFTIVGVAPRGFAGVSNRPVDVFIPVSAAKGLRFAGQNWASDHRSTWMSVVARLNSGVMPEAAGREVAAIVRGEGERTSGKPDTTTRAVPLASVLPNRQPELTAEKRVALLLGAVSTLVLLIACANVANLLLARALQRRREIAVRLALGIARGRLVRQLAVEGVLLALIGGAAALLVVRWGSAVVQNVILTQYAWPASPIDLRVLAFTIAVTVGVGLLAALIPAVQASAPNLSLTLKEGSRGAGLSHSRTRVVLLLVQAALSVVLLVGTGLFVLSLRHVHDVELGIDIDRLVIGKIDLRAVGIDSGVADEYFRNALVAVRRVPGVASATVAEAAPFSDWSMGTSIRIPGRDSVPDFDDGPSKTAVQEGYFSTVGTRIVRGRPLTDDDLRAGAEPVVVINESAAQRLWPGEDAVGKCFSTEEYGNADAPCTRIVGLAEDTHRQRIVETGTRMRIYQPFGSPFNSGPRAYALIARAGSGDPALIAEPVRRAMQSVRPGLPHANVQPMVAMLENELRPWRLGATVFGAFGALALVLSALGLYGVVSYSVTQRMHEMGVRVALGAQAADIVRLVLRQGLAVAAAGVVMGIAFAMAGARFVEPLLYEVSPREPMVFLVVTVTLLLAATGASMVPAVRATRADPLRALRAE